MIVSSAETVANIEDLLTEILLRVPAKTLTCFKCVSKHWLSLISSPSFRNSHSTRYKSLYICLSERTCLSEITGMNFIPRYRVHAIKLSDLFSLSDTTVSPITIDPSKSKFESESKVVREVAFVGGDDDSELPIYMGFGVFGSRIVLTGGYFYNRKFYHDPKPCYVLDTTDPKASFDKSLFPEITQDRMMNLHLEEIDGKLYALSSEHFLVYDPYSETNQSQTKVWTPLQPLPIRLTPFSCSVVDSMILATVPNEITFCYDVAASDGSWTRIRPLLTYQRDVQPMWYLPDKALVVDCEDGEFDKLMFNLYYEKIVVFGIRLFKEGVPTEYEPEAVPTEYELVAAMDLPELPRLSGNSLSSFSGAYLGDGKVCFALLYLNYALLVFTFDFTYEKAGAISPPHDISSSSTRDSSNLCYTSFYGSFSAKAPGYYLFEYNYDEQSPQPSTFLSECFVL